MISTNNIQRGAVSIYIVLLVLFTVTSAAMVLSSILSRQLRASQDIVATERAFYAANSGIEEGFARLLQTLDSGETLSISGTIEYDDGPASYGGKAHLTGEADEQRSACITSQGDSRGRQRRLTIEPAGQVCEF